MTWLPIPSGVATQAAPAAAAAVRGRLGANNGRLVVGHFGTFGGQVAAAVAAVLPALLQADPDRTALLVGRGGGAFAERLRGAHPGVAGRVHATGGLPPEAVAAHLAACDLLVQPYPDGVSSRRSSLMAGLALGLPIATTAGFLTEPIWQEQRLAALTPANHLAALADAAEALLVDPAARAALAARARAGYDRHFSLAHTVHALRAAADA
jgi:glycosyltransferase involved in cell wall biosynthesis